MKMDYEKVDDEIEKTKQAEMPCADFYSMKKAAEEESMDKFFRTPELSAVRKLIEDNESKEDELEE